MHIRFITPLAVGGLQAIPQSVRLSVPALGAQLPWAIGTLAACSLATCGLRTRGVHGNGEDWDPMGLMGFPWELE